MSRGMAQHLKSIGAIRSNPIHRAIFVQNMVEIDGLTVDLGRDKIFCRARWHQLYHSGSRMNVNGLSVREANVNTIHAGGL
jgi:hypothetical protein